MVMPLSGPVNVSAIAGKLNISDLYDRLPKERAVQVKFPKFKLEYTQELQDVLTKMGKTFQLDTVIVFFCDQLFSLNFISISNRLQKEKLSSP